MEDFSQAGITAVKFSSPHLAGLLPLDAAAVEDVNTFALCLREMEQEDGELRKFCAVLEAEQPETFTKALNIAMDRDDYEQIPEDMDEYGKQVLRRAGADDEIIDTIDGYMDFARLGEDSMEEDGVRRTEFRMDSTAAISISKKQGITGGNSYVISNGLFSHQQQRLYLWLVKRSGKKCIQRRKPPHV